MKLSLLPGHYAITRFPVLTDPSLLIPASPFWSITSTQDEISVVCYETDIPAGGQSEIGWRVLQVEGPLEFSMVGVLAKLTAPLAAAGVPIFVISTFLTDYLMVKEEALARALGCLSEAGHECSPLLRGALQ